MHPIVCQTDAPLAIITLNDPDRRNAMTLAMFDALDEALSGLSGRADVSTLLLRGEGPAFCAGFDLSAAVEQPELTGECIRRLGRLTRTVRRLPQVVVASVRGAAIAGGCALVSACDFIFAGPNARFGYPVHQLGISPAVTIATLSTRIGPGPTRALLLSGELINADRACRLGLVTHVAASDEAVDDEARGHARALSEKDAHALRVTKAWLNELDGSLDDARYDGPAEASALAAVEPRAVELLRAGWARRA